MKKWSISAKFGFIVGIFILASVSIAVLGISRLNELNQALNQVVGVTANRALMAKSMISLTNEVRNIEKVFILEDTPEGMNKVDETLNSRESALRKGMADYSVIATEAGKKDLKEMEGILNDWKPVSAEIRSYSRQGKNKEAIALARGKSKDLLEKFGSILNEMAQRNDKEMQEESERTDVLYAHSRNFMILISSVAIITGVLLAFFILRAMNRAIDQVISTLTDNSNQVASAAQQIAASSEQLSQSSSEQAASLQQTSASINEMNAMVQKNSDNANQSAQLAGKSRTSATRGREVVGEMIQSINAINQSNEAIMTQIDQSNREIGEIVQVITEIGNKTKIINDIVFQTKLLSFNASVEAARAGEHGKGFAVVAEEVGNLAQMSGNAAKEIATMLEGSIQKVEGIIKNSSTRVQQLMGEAKQKVTQGAQVAGQCGEVLTEIVGQVSQANEMATEISSASKEQSQGIQEITKAVAQLDQVTQENASASEEAASSAEELSAQAESLKRTVRTLVETVKGESDSREGALPTIGRMEDVSAQKAKPVAPARGGKVVSFRPEQKKEISQPVFEVPAESDPRFKEA